MQFFATPYTIHFDDTMAYGSHHFLTSFKFQCSSREAFLFGEKIFDVEGVSEALDKVHLFTSDAYARNLNPARLGDRVVILLSIEEWHRASSRFCYRVIDASGRPITVGFQTLVCADAQTGQPIPLPPPLWGAMEKLRGIEEPISEISFRDRVLAGGKKIDSLIGAREQATAKQYLTARYPSPQVITATEVQGQPLPPEPRAAASDSSNAAEAWVFPGQGAFDANRLSLLTCSYLEGDTNACKVLDQCRDIAESFFGEQARHIFEGDQNASISAIQQVPQLEQLAIFLQNVLGFEFRKRQGYKPSFLAGLSFGEVAAYCTAGCFDIPTGIRIVSERVKAVDQTGPQGGGLLAVLSSRRVTSTELGISGLQDLVIAGRNHEQQTVVSGPIEQLKSFAEILKKQQISSIELPSPAAFHHPSLKPAATTWFNSIKNLTISPPVIPLYSPNGRRFITNRDDIASTLTSQLLRPFDFQGGIADLINSGVNRFVDCGSAGFLKKIVAKAAPTGFDITGINLPTIDAKPSEVIRSTTPPSKASLTFPDRSKQTDSNTAANVAVGIYGQGCILPGGVTSPSELFSAIEERRSGLVDQRTIDPYWEEDFYSAERTPDRSTSHLSGRIADHLIVAPDGVDPEVFNRFSRTQKLLCISLATCVDAIGDAERVLCLVGATADGFEDQDVVASLRCAGIDPLRDAVPDLGTAPGSVFQEPHAAVQEVFDHVVRVGLEVVMLDAACASSLYSVGLGMRALESGTTDAVIAGGVFCPGQGNSCLFSQFGGTTSTGLRPFDQNADGVVFSEGASFVTLRRVEDAKHDAQEPTAILRGFGLSSDGRSSSANVPQTRGQILSLERCYKDYSISPSTIDAVEAHGTSTPVGDGTEVETLRAFFSDKTSHPIPIHSLKGLLGHAGWAAGTASIIAACEYLNRSQFPAQANFRSGSTAVQKAQATVAVPSRPVNFETNLNRIAINGFGFGGANAHFVLDHPRTAPFHRNPIHDRKRSDNELVIVATHEVKPTISTDQGGQFDRSEVALPQGHVVLPDLADDMDVSQKLAVGLVDGLLKQLPEMSDQERQQTGLLLAQSGKTERGVEATLRVLANRLKRQLARRPDLSAKIEQTRNATKPSGPYTLQCMMPNVSAGRAMLQHNLNGPNFVVDSGARSLEESFQMAKLLLQAGEESGIKLLMIAAINANPWRIPQGDQLDREGEYAVSFAVTTKQNASEMNLSILAELSSVLNPSTESAGSTEDKVRQILNKIHAQLEDSKTEIVDQGDSLHSETTFPIYAPTWVESSTESNPDVDHRSFRTAIFLPAVSPNLSQLLSSLPSQFNEFLVVLVGDTAEQTASKFSSERVFGVHLDKGSSLDSITAKLDNFHADAFVAFDSVGTWEQPEVLRQVAEDNSLCEAMFLLAKHNSDRLMSGELKLWGLFQNAYQGVAHPKTGAMAGLLKSIGREYSNAKVGIICRDDDNIPRSLFCLANEMTTPAHDVEIAYQGKTRKVRRLRQVVESRHSRTKVQLSSDSVVIATGGARGVTSVMVESLLQDYGCHVIALGRSELEQGPAGSDEREIEKEFFSQFVRKNPGVSPVEMRRQFERKQSSWEAFRRIEELSHCGGSIEYRAVDVTDAQQVESVINEVLAKYGRVDFLLHGAGVQYSKRLEQRTLAEFRRTFSVKVSGLQNIVSQYQAISGKTLPAHVLTSAYSIFGNDGQHDYGAANETLDRLCQFTSIEGVSNWSSIAWLAWDGVGMTRGSEYKALSKQRDLSGVNEEAGKSIFRRVMSGATGAHINVPMTESEHKRYEIATIPVSTATDPNRFVEQNIDLKNIDCLPHHQVRGIPTLPGAWILDQMASVALQLCDHQQPPESVIFHNINFQKFVKQNLQNTNLRIVAELDDQHIRAWLLGDLRHPGGTVLVKDSIFAEAELEFVSREESSLSEPLLFEVNSGTTLVREAGDPYCSSNNHEIELTGPFDCVRDITTATAGRQARFVPSHQRLQTSAIPALVLDAALRVGAMYAADDPEALFVPVAIRRLVAPLGFLADHLETNVCEIRATAPVVEHENAKWESTQVYDTSGEPILIVEGAFAARVN